METVDFQPHETLGLPPPVTPATVGARVIHQQRTDEKKRLGIDEENVPEPTESTNGKLLAHKELIWKRLHKQNNVLPMLLSYYSVLSNII